MRMEWLKQQLSERGITQVEVATAIGLTEAQMSKIIGGTRLVKSHEADAIRRFLGYHLPDDPADAPEVRIMDHISRLGTDQKQAVETFLSQMFPHR